MRTIKVIENKEELKNVLIKEDVVLRITIGDFDFESSNSGFSFDHLSNYEITEFIREILNDRGIVVTFTFR